MLLRVLAFLSIFVIISGERVSFLEVSEGKYKPISSQKTSGDLTCSDQQCWDSETCCEQVNGDNSCCPLYQDDARKEKARIPEEIKHFVTGRSLLATKDNLPQKKPLSTTQKKPVTVSSTVKPSQPVKEPQGKLATKKSTESGSAQKINIVGIKSSKANPQVNQQNLKNSPPKTHAVKKKQPVKPTTLKVAEKAENTKPIKKQDSPVKPGSKSVSEKDTGTCTNKKDPKCGAKLENKYAKPTSKVGGKQIDTKQERDEKNVGIGKGTTKKTGQGVEGKTEEDTGIVGKVKKLFRSFFNSFFINGADAMVIPIPQDTQRARTILDKIFCRNHHQLQCPDGKTCCHMKNGKNGCCLSP